MKPGRKKPSSKTAESQTGPRHDSILSPTKGTTTRSNHTPERILEPPGYNEVVAGGRRTYRRSIDTGKLSVDIALVMTVLDDVCGRETEESSDHDTCDDDYWNR